MDTRIKNVVVVGGGTAGWLSAAYILRWLRQAGVRDTKVTLVESAEIGVIGVGEATIPDLKATLRYLNIDEKEFMVRTNAGFKSAIKFVNWRDDPKEVGDHHFYHPFERPPIIRGLSFSDVWLLGRSHYGQEDDFAYVAGLAPTLCDYYRSPKAPNNKPFQGECNYAYHLDAVLFGHYLRDIAKSRGVNHVVDLVTDVHLNENGFVRALQTKEHGELEGDLFIDCSGFAGLIINKVLKADWVDFSDDLFCDRAVALRVPYGASYATINPFTISTAKNAGWTWEIHLAGKEGNEDMGRRGIGYVYSSKFISDDDAEQELREHIGPTAEGVEARLLRLRVGQNRQAWIKNCVSIGLSAGFIEPLESTGISLISSGLRILTANFPSKVHSQALVDRYNNCMDRLYSHLRDFIVMHYCLTRREDTEFWRANKNNTAISDRLKEDIKVWKRRPPVEWDNDTGFRFFPPASYQCILSGLDHLPDPEQYIGPRISPELVEKAYANMKVRQKKALTVCPDHRGSLDLIHSPAAHDAMAGGQAQAAV